nr:TonB-dependent receptor [Sphingomicrobium sediminis]
MLAGAAFAAAPALAEPVASFDENDVVLDGGEEGPGDPIVVTGTRDGYGQQRSRSATRTDADLNDVPQSISIVTDEQIADQALRSVADVVRYVPGISAESGEGHRDAIIIRGQSSTADFYTDGLRDDVQHYRGLYNVERVEILKGPNALVFGRGGGGGVVNRVLKRPFHEEYFAGGVSIDNEGAGFAEIDLNSPLGSTVEGRLVAVYERFDDFRDIEGERFAINPTLSWHVGEATRLDLGYEYAKDERDVDRGLPPAREGTVADPARAVEGFDTTFFGVRGQNRTDFEKQVVDARLEHELAPGVLFTSKALYGDYDKIYTNALPSSAVTDIDGVDSVKITAYQDFTYRQNFLVTNDLVAEFDTGSIGHTLLIGADYARQDTEAGRLRGFFDGLPADEKSPNGRETFVPLADPVDIPAITYRSGSGERRADTDVEALGLFVQNQFRIGETVEVIAGLRHDWVDVRVRDFIGDTDLERSDSLWSPRLGVVLMPKRPLSFYASWSRSYLPQSGDQFSSLSVTTAALEPERFTSVEAGVKWRIMDGLDLTMAAYRLDRTNVRATDPDTFETVLTGEQRAEGIEMEMHGKIGRFSLSGGVAFQNAEITQDTAAAPAGRQVADLPDFEATLWGRYDVTERLGLGIGVNHRSSMFTSFSNEVIIDPVTRLDGALFYDLGDKIALQVNVENILGEDGIEFAHNDNNLYPVAPRNVRGTIRFAF